MKNKALEELDALNDSIQDTKEALLKAGVEADRAGWFVGALESITALMRIELTEDHDPHVGFTVDDKNRVHFEKGEINEPKTD